METPPSHGPADIGRALLEFVDALIPGDGVFPPASAVGAHGILAARLRDVAGPDAPAGLARAFIERDGFDAPAEAAGRLQREDPQLFDRAQTVLYYAYYETPPVIAAIRELGNDYNDSPQPRGYPMRPFDPLLDAPAGRRGFYRGTDEVVRVDLSGLDFLRGGSDR